MRALIFALIFSPTLALAQYQYKFDHNTGNSYSTYTDSNGRTTVRGYGASGSSWNTTIDNNGDQRGTDSSGNSWNYDSGTGWYNNTGTGEMRNTRYGN